MDALDILKAARAKISKPEDWGKGRRNEDRHMETCCAAEAIEECLDGHPVEERIRAFRALKNAAGLDNDWGAMMHWNDAPERTHAEVLAAYDLAIATLSLGSRVTGGKEGVAT